MFNQSLVSNITVLIITTLITLVILLLKWRMKYWERRGVYSLPTNIFFGNSKSLLFKKEGIGAVLENYYDHFKSKGKLFGGYYFLFRPILIPVDLNIIKQIMITDFDYFTDRVFQISDSDVLSNHLVSVKGSTWKKLRSILSPAFTSTKNKQMFSLVLKCVNNLIEHIDKNAEEKNSVEMKNIASRMSMDVIGSCAFGVDSLSLKNSNSDFNKYTQRYFNPSTKNNMIRLFTVLYPEVLDLLGLHFADRETQTYFVTLVKSIIKIRQDSSEIRNDFLNTLIKIKEEQSQQLNKDTNKFVITAEVIAAQCFFFLIAGYEAVSSAVTCCLYELALNQNIQQTLRKEIENCTNKDIEPTYENIMEMPFLDKCVKETLRKYPPTPLAFRECTKTYSLPESNLTIEKGVAIFVSILGIHKDPEFYPDPERFDPERFTKQNEINRHPCAYIPFGCGPRNCVAYKFGLLQVKLTITKLVRRYKFFVNSRTKVPIVMDTTSLLARPLDGVWLDVEKV